MRLDEAPEHVQLLVQLDDHVVLLQVLGRRARNLLLLGSLALALARDADNALAHGDVLGVVERESGEVLDRLGLRRREEERLAGLGQVRNDGVDRGGEAHVEDPICLVEHCRLVSASKATSTHAPSTWSWSHSKPIVWSICCSSRPGVATRMFMRSMRPCSSFKLLPPITSPAENWCLCPIFLSTSKIWTACDRQCWRAAMKVIRTSSRVGEMTSAPKPSVGPHFLRNKISRTGMRNASVLPLPVRAAPSTSFPLSARGRARAWMSVSLL